MLRDLYLDWMYNWISARPPNPFRCAQHGNMNGARTANDDFWLFDCFPFGAESFAARPRALNDANAKFPSTNTFLLSFVSPRCRNFSHSSAGPERAVAPHLHRRKCETARASYAAGKSACFFTHRVFGARTTERSNNSNNQHRSHQQLLDNRRYFHLIHFTYEMRTEIFN